MRPEPKYRVGDVVCDVVYERERKYHFKVGTIYWHEIIKEESKWCYLPSDEEPDWPAIGMREDAVERAPQNSYWEGYLELVKRKVTMEENE